MSNEIVDRYCEAWSDADPDKRAAKLAAVLASDGSYTDPTVHVTGAAALLDHIAGVLSRRPGSKVARTSPVERHHDVARFNWAAITPDGTALKDGVDIVIFDQTDKMTRIIGFFGTGLPAS